MRINVLGLLMCMVGGVVCSCQRDMPEAAASSPGFNLFVSLPAADAIVRIDPAHNAILQKTRIGSLPHHFLLHPDGKRLYVVLVGSQAVAEINVATGALQRTLLTDVTPLTREDGSVIQAHIDRKADTHTSCYDCHNHDPNGARPVVVGARPFALAFNADASELYVTNMRTRSLATLDLASGTLVDITALPARGDAAEPTGLARVQDNLYVAMRPGITSGSSGALRRLEGNAHVITSDAANGSNTSVVLADDLRKRVYVNNFETNTVTAFGAAGEHLTTYTVGPGPLGLRLVDQGRRLVAANYYDNSISIVDVAGGETRTHPLGMGDRHFVNPTHTALDPSGLTLYVVSSGTQGHLLAFDVNSEQFTQAIAIDGLPFDVVTVATRTANE
ncbi:MAG: hypothetical protein OEW08_09525 [Gammaproteobacteria bacterium]|nr:hypothetical protein [Gammaproteobacteria bacterium]